MAASVRSRVGRPVSTGKSRKVIERLQKKVEDGSFYEAHQTYRVLYQRFCAQGNEEQAIRLLQEGASTLLKHEQWESGTDLGLMLVSHLKENKSPITEDTLDMISQLFILYTNPTIHHTPSSVLPAEVDPREVFMRAALKWSSMVGGEDCKYGHPHLHKMLAISYWEVNQYARAREHFQYACQPEDYAHMLVEVATLHGRPHEADLFVAQAVLQLLVVKNRRSAMGVFSVYTQTHSAFRRLEGPPYQDIPLLNFTWFLLLSTESGDPQVFLFLRQRYRRALARDPCFNEYLDKIGATYFSLQVAGGSNSAGSREGGLGGLLGMLGGEGGLGGLLGGGGGGGGGGAGGGGDFLGNLMGSLSGALTQTTPSASQSVAAAPQPAVPPKPHAPMLQSMDIVD